MIFQKDSQNSETLLYSQLRFITAKGYGFKLVREKSTEDRIQEKSGARFQLSPASRVL